MNRPAADLTDLCALVSHRNVVETLDLLAHTSATVTELAAAIPGGRRTVQPALRVLAAAGLATHGHGSWDCAHAGADPVRLTERGWRTVEALSSVEGWTEMYEQSDAAPR
ncbi:ArsR/SmtB family transcription factor [Nocardia crassostreae]|uniref:ArsR/SmtB family transcription factor n=1 Tax=Nocardia crassostreae TaxID=53428 RepID=UPI000834DC97|nr:helix-turn-helix transcriptional regulator [Nocardia crassostreae]